MFDNEYLDAPGCLTDIIAHPDGHNQKSIEIAIMLSHRFAFFYWNKWTKRISGKGNSVPNSISIDWHQDLCHPADIEMETLKNLDINDNLEIGIYTWSELNPLNDSHILSAAYLNLIGDIFVLCKQNESEPESKFKDFSNSEHKVYTFTNTEDLIKKIIEIDYPSFYFDIDSDYFMESDDVYGDEGEILNDKDIKSFFKSNDKLWKLVYKGMEGFTIATEPKWCNGIKNSNMIMNILDNYFFAGTLFSKNSEWTHLKEIGYYK